MKTRIILVSVLSLGITLFSPFLFTSYIQERPEELTKSITFGGPFPFAEQMVTLPSEANSYPLQVSFVSPLDQEMDFKIIPFILSFISFFAFFFSLISIIFYYFNRGMKKNDES